MQIGQDQCSYCRGVIMNARFTIHYLCTGPRYLSSVVEKYLDCGNPMCGFARIQCPDCGEERLLMFSCKTRGFCPSCHAKRHEEWEEWMREELLLDTPHRQVVFTVPKMLRLFFRFKRKLLNSLCLSAVRALVRFLYR